MRSLAYCASSAVTVATAFPADHSGGPHLHPGQIARRPGQTLQALDHLFMRQRQVALHNIGKQLFAHARYQQTGEFPSNSCGQKAFSVIMACSGGSRRR